MFWETHTHTHKLKRARRVRFIRERITQVVKNALRGLQRNIDEHVNVKTYVFNRQGSSSTRKRMDLITFPALSVPDRHRPMAVIHDQVLTWGIVGKNFCHTKHPPDPCLLNSALWTLGTILNGFRRLSGMTSPLCRTRVKANLQCYCALQHRFLNSGEHSCSKNTLFAQSANSSEQENS